MIACDFCRDVTKPAGEHRVALARVVAGDKRSSLVTVDSVAAELCDECARKMFERVRAFFTVGTVEGQTQ